MFFPFFVFSQGETNFWYFGQKAGLDFSSNTPLPLSNGQMIAQEGCTSISDVNGNLLFYTAGDTIWNKQHQIMANGTGIFAGWSNTQSAQIVKWPGNNIKYYLFTLSKGDFYNDTLYYSIIDMSLAAGNGSVVSKNNLLRTGCTEKMCLTKNCNGIDYWLVVHQASSGNFLSYLINNSGLNTTPVISPSGITNNMLGQMKVSPNGKKLAMANYTCTSRFALFDFNSNSGVVSNSLTLMNNLTSSTYAYGCEFSSDGTKLYGTENGLQTIYSGLYQWDLCAGSNTAIINSINSTTVSNSHYYYGMQLARNNKIYVATANPNLYFTISQINSPNTYSTGMGLASGGQSLGSRKSNIGLPSFDNTLFKFKPTTFNYSISAAPNCNTYTFYAPSLNFSCASSNYQSLSWNFNDLLSGSTNSSNVNNPIHNFSGPGAYTVLLLLHTPCLTDTIKKQIIVSSPTLVISGNTTVCPFQTTSLTVSGANSYTWSSGVQSHSISINPSITTQYSVVGTNTVTGCVVSKVFTLNVNKCLQLLKSQKQQNNIRLYPNPASGLIYFDVPFENEISVYIFNQLGQLLLEEKKYQSMSAFDVKLLPPDLYYYKIVTKLSSYSGKFVKE